MRMAVSSLDALAMCLLECNECRILCAALCKNKHFIFLYCTETTRTTYQVPGIYTAAVRTAATVVYSRYPRSCCFTKQVTPLESSRGHHLPARSASARAACRRCFDPKRAATAPGCRACSASRGRRVGSLLVVGQDQTQAHSCSSTRGSSATPDDGTHIHRIVPPRCRTKSSWLRAG